MVVLSASAHDNEAGIALLDQAAERCGMRLEKVLVDQGFEDAGIVHGAVNDTTVEVVRRQPRRRGQISPRYDTASRGPTEVAPRNGNCG
ncbi:hypothetical protein ACIPW9_36625 [Streptomyces sp. NPDC090052]|uniref:hypothetical protein n=1 Tax=Streptomyces sp. NPDC090052 TaxID=3365931 RepID=UPI003823B0D2